MPESLKKSLLMSTLALLIVLGVKGRGHCASDITFAVLPVMQALPIYVADEMGFFTDAGLDVDVKTFASGADKDIALRSGVADGAFGDVFLPVLMEGNGTDLSIVATNYISGDKAHMFAVMASKQSGITSIEDLAGVEIAISNNTVIDYVTETLLLRGGLAPEDIVVTDMKNIGLRMQMLLSGEMDASTIVEPLVTAAAGAGAVIIATDTGMSVSQTTLAFRQDWLDKEGNADAATRFLGAVNRANVFIADNPQRAREILIDNVRMPENLQQEFPLPVFPERMDVPDEETISEVVNWMLGRKLFERNLTYTELVNGAYLPRAD